MALLAPAVLLLAGVQVTAPDMLSLGGWTAEQVEDVGEATARAALFGALILQAVLSWVNPYSPLAAPANQLTRPLLDPIRRIIPTISGIDLSPLVAILLLQMALMFL